MTREKAIDLVRKLANLADPAKNSNENERAVAIKQAQALVDRFSLKLHDFEVAAPVPATKVYWQPANGWYVYTGSSTTTGWGQTSWNSW